MSIYDAYSFYGWHNGQYYEITVPAKSRKEAIKAANKIKNNRSLDGELKELKWNH